MKKAGAYVGHELLFGRLAFVSHLGFYLYNPYKSNKFYYERLGLKYHFTAPGVRQRRPQNSPRRRRRDRVAAGTEALICCRNKQRPTVSGGLRPGWDAPANG